MHTHPSTFVLIPGAGSDAWIWHLVVAELERRGHAAIAVDLPCEDPAAGLPEYVDAVVAAIGERRDVTIVAQSLAGFTGPLVCERVPVKLLVLVNAMIPRPGESAGEWWDATRHEEAIAPLIARHGPMHQWGPGALAEVFVHDVPPALAAESAHHVRRQSGGPFTTPWPLKAWPAVPTRVLVGRDDRLFPPEFQRRVARERLGVTPDELDGGHLLMLSRPVELAERLVRYRDELE
jgi:pimeloyl-ACP methyl ester carboxylesterase